MAQVKKRGRPASPGNTGASGVKSLIRGLSLLDRMADTPGGASLTALAQQVGLAASTTHRLLNTLERARYACQDEESGLWRVGMRAFVVGHSFLANRDLVAQSRPHMRRLMESSGETVNLAVLDDGEAVFVSQVECAEMVRMLANIGTRPPMHASAVCKAFLAALPESEVAPILHRHGMPQLTRKTLVTPERLKRNLAGIRRNGYSVDDEEQAVGLRCIAATIHDEHGAPLAALSLSGPRARITDDRIAELAQMVLNTTGDITRALGGHLPDWREGNSPAAERRAGKRASQ